MVSACLLGQNCKYSGKNNLSGVTVDFCRGHSVVPVCPEVLGGLPVPRKPAELCNGKVCTRDGRSVDQEFRKGAALALKLALDEGVELAILQPRSPSCGLRQVYDGSFSGKKIEGKGVFATLLLEHGIKAVEPDDLPVSMQ